MNLTRIIQEVQPDEIYNLAAINYVAVSFQTPEYVANVDGTETLRILEAVKLLGLTRKTKIYQASTSELYGKVQETPQSETTPCKLHSLGWKHRVELEDWVRAMYAWYLK